MIMLHIQDLQELFLQNYHDITKQEIEEELSDIFELIDDAFEHMQKEYQVGEYNYNFKQTFKYLLKNRYQYSTTQLQRKKDIIVHYREMLQLDMAVLNDHVSKLLTHDILDAKLLQSYHHNITEIQKKIAHFSAVIKSLKEMIEER